jgi:hypothetical protein
MPSSGFLADEFSADAEQELSLGRPISPAAESLHKSTIDEAKSGHGSARKSLDNRKMTPQHLLKELSRVLVSFTCPTIMYIWRLILTSKTLFLVCFITATATSSASLYQRSRGIQNTYGQTIAHP